PVTPNSLNSRRVRRMRPKRSWRLPWHTRIRVGQTSQPSGSGRSVKGLFPPSRTRDCAGSSRLG
ncbi:uncharacterized protein METZ01_LOCUS163914, partial [marine metagenome]